MKMSTIISLIKLVLLGVVLFVLKQLLVIYAHEYISYIEIITIYLLIVIFCTNIELGKWVFIVGFFLGVIKATWIGQRLGIMSSYYMLLTFPYLFYKNMASGMFQLILMVVAAMILKFLVYGGIALLLNDELILQFITSQEYLFQVIATLSFIIIFFIPLKKILRKYT